MPDLDPLRAKIIVDNSEANTKLDETNKKIKDLGQSSEGAAGEAEGFAGSLGMLGEAAGPVGVAIAAEIAVITAVMTVMTEAAVATVEYASKLSDLSGVTGINTEALQRLSYEGSLVGVSIETANRAIFAMDQHLEKTPDKFTKLGLSLQELHNLEPEEQFYKVAEALRAIEDPAERDRMAIDLFGVGARRVMPLIMSDIQGATDRARELGIVIDASMIARLDGVGDAATTLKETWDKLWMRIAISVMENVDVQQGLEDLAKGLAFVGDMVKEHGEAIWNLVNLLTTQIPRAVGLAIDALKLLDAFYQEYAGPERELPKLKGLPEPGSVTPDIAGATLAEMAALDAAAKEHVKALKEVEKAAADWEKAETSAVSKIGTHFEKLRAQHDAQAIAHEKYMDEFGKSAEELETELNRLVVNYHDVEEAEGDAMTTAQIENFRMKLDEAVNSMELLRDYTTETGEEIKGLGPYSEDAFDEMAESGDKLHEKLKALGLTIEHEDGTWERVGRSGKEAHEKIGAATEHTISLQRQLEMAIGDVGNVINGVKDLEDLFGISADSAFGKVVDGAGKAVSAIESIINVIKGMNSLIGTIESIAKAFSNIAGGASATTSAVEGTAAAAGGTATAAGGATTSLAGTAAAIGTVAASAAAFGIVAYGLTRLFFGGERPAFDASDPAQRKEVGDYLAGGGLGYDNVYKGPSGYGGHNTGGPPTDHPTGPPPVHAAAGFYSPSMPAGPLSDGGTMITVHPREEVSVTPEGQTSRGGSSGNMSVTSQPQFHIGTVIGSPDELWSMVAKGLRANNAELVGAIRQISWRG